MRPRPVRPVAAGGRGYVAACLPVILVAVACTGVPFERQTPAPTALRTATPGESATSGPTVTPRATPTPSPSAGGWQAVIFDRPESPASIQALAARGPVLVAAGSAGGGGAVWTLESDGEWERATEVPPAEEDEFLTLVDVATSPRGLIAVGVGGAPQSEPGFSVVWFSGDGIRWREVERIDGVLLETVVSSGGTVLAAGGIGSAVGGPHGVAIWHSPDGGTTWTESQATDDLGMATITGIVAAEQGFVAVGFARDDPAAFDIVSAVWTSPSGEQWTRVPHVETFGQSGMRAVTIGSGAYVAVGSDHAAGTARPAVWTSGAATEWERAPIDPVDGALTAVGPTSDGFAAVGYVQSGGETRLALATSPDGAAWTFDPEIEAEGTGFLHDVIAFYGRLIAVGEVTDAETNETRPIVISRPLN